MEGAGARAANRADVQLACSSAVLDHLFVRGEFTQLEWIDFVARSLAVDGVVFDARHFPRFDVEYLAEVRKLCVDRGLTIAALAVEDLFLRDEAELDLVFGLAAAIGTCVLITTPPVPGENAVAAWRDAATRGKAIARLAKRANVTVGVRNASDTLCTNAAELKRLTKDIDSSWVRFAPDVSALTAEDLLALHVRTVITTTRNLEAPAGDPARKGFLVLEPPIEEITIPALVDALRRFAERLMRPAAAAS